jgi:hypothetical protein
MIDNRMALHFAVAAQVSWMKSVSVSIATC